MKKIENSFYEYFNTIIHTKIFEKLLNLTIILGVASKSLGAVLGVIKTIIYVFIVMYILSLPTFNFKVIRDSKIGNAILDKTPILAGVCDKTLSVFNEIMDLKEEYETTNNVGEFNQKALNIMIDKGVITKENAKNLVNEFIEEVEEKQSEKQEEKKVVEKKKNTTKKKTNTTKKTTTQKKNTNNKKSSK